MKTQKEQILNLLKRGRKITPLDALKKFGCFRLGARIWELKKEGYEIESQFVYKNDKRFSQYFMRTE